MANFLIPNRVEKSNHVTVIRLVFGETPEDTDDASRIIPTSISQRATTSTLLNFQNHDEGGEAVRRKMYLYGL